MMFGLLGVHGAGKTTTFQMRSGLTTPTAGGVSIMGLDVFANVEAARRHIRYCPQFDCMIPMLTPLDHLTLFDRRA